jgi:metal-responsive CopG/Arc/MetJ family transcriptional regulator
MKDKVIPIRISTTEIEEINNQFKEELINHELISRSEFIRRLLKLGIEAHKKENAKTKRK